MSAEFAENLAIQQPMGCPRAFMKPLMLKAHLLFMCKYCQFPAQIKTTNTAAFMQGSEQRNLTG